MQVVSSDPPMCNRHRQRFACSAIRVRHNTRDRVLSMFYSLEITALQQKNMFWATGSAGRLPILSGCCMPGR